MITRSFSARKNARTSKGNSAGRPSPYRAHHNSFGNSRKTKGATGGGGAAARPPHRSSLEQDVYRGAFRPYKDVLSRRRQSAPPPPQPTVAETGAGVDSYIWKRGGSDKLRAPQIHAR